MKLKQQSRPAQHLALTPRQQQSIRLLQLSATDLHLELDKILQDNPLLERGDTPPGTPEREKTPQETLPDFSSSSSPGIPSDEEWTSSRIEAPEMSLREHLLAQIRLTLIDRRQLALAELIIDALDENGYLVEKLEEMLDWLPDELDIRIEELELALSKVQALEPAGVAAGSPAECLAIQLKRLPGLPYITRKRALAIVENHLPLLARRDFSRLKKHLGCDDEDLDEAQKAIQRCHPHPGARFSPEKAHTLVPELIAFEENEQWHVALNPSAIPHIRLNAAYADIMKNAETRQTAKTHLQEANWLIRNLRKRFDTILRTGQTIVELQQKFFSEGAVAMRPLVLREIADTLELHESTISRVTTQKYMHTPHGIVELKYFFGSHLVTESGSTVSSTAIREQIRQLIGAENRKKPLSDNKIALILGEQGLVIARRTVAKYRETLKIPPAHMRKSL
ncbi:RNA polymerase factor sigma-54 [Oxalobacter sp. OttesenSCG-928-P03]|nr:RNA polymerase factor sigma-54 [Oxalobacter sp. OttesenSCG-928-P03]